MRSIKLHTPVLMADHIRYKSGKAKTVCVTYCLTALGIAFDSFTVTGSLDKPNYLGILNREGFSARSRRSKLSKTATIGNSRAAIRKMSDSAQDIYWVVILGDHYGDRVGSKKGGYCHAVLVNGNGEVVVDNAISQVKRDHRKIHSIHKITRA